MDNMYLHYQEWKDKYLTLRESVRRSTPRVKGCKQSKHLTNRFSQVVYLSSS